jgi:hypothetical protein
MRLRWLLAPIPAGLGLMMAALTQGGWLDNPIVYIRADVGTLSLLLGLILSGLIGMFFVREMGWRMSRTTLLRQARAKPWPVWRRRC